MENIVKISKPGKDVDSDDPRDWEFHSNYPIINTAFIIRGEDDGTDPTDPLKIHHGLGYTPLVMMYEEYGSTGEWANVPAYRVGQPSFSTTASDLDHLDLYRYSTAFKYCFLVFTSETSIP